MDCDIVELNIACAIDNPSVAFCQAVNAALTFLAKITLRILPGETCKQWSIRF